MGGHGAALQIINQVHGVIDATGPNGLTIDTPPRATARCSRYWANWLNDAPAFTGHVAGFASDDAIYLGDLAAAYTTITKIIGTAAAGFLTNVTNDSQSSRSLTLHLVNQFAGQYGVQVSDYHLSADGQ